MHRIYGLYCDDVLYYVGYSDRELTTRLNEHIYSATNPTKQQLVSEAIAGEVSPKRKIILEALKEGYELTIQMLHECPTHEPIDEEEWIQHYRQTGHYLTNKATGGVFQKLVLMPDGSLVEPNRSQTTAETKIDVWCKLQDAKKAKKAQKVLEGAEKLKASRPPSPWKHLTEAQRKQKMIEELGEDFVNSIAKFGKRKCDTPQRFGND